MGKIDRNSIEAARSLTGGLKAKSRRRRESLKRLAKSSSVARATRNHLLPQLDLVYVLLEDLRTPAREVRKLDPAHVREVANSIGTLGFCAPVLVGKDNLVLDGAVRVQAARLLGLGRAPCIRIEYLSEKEERVLRLAANRLGEKGEWDLDELKIEFQELILVDAPIESLASPWTRSTRSFLAKRTTPSSRGLSRPSLTPLPLLALAIFLRLGSTASYAAARSTRRPSDS